MTMASLQEEEEVKKKAGEEILSLFNNNFIPFMASSQEKAEPTKKAEEEILVNTGKEQCIFRSSRLYFTLIIGTPAIVQVNFNNVDPEISTHQ